MLQFWCLFPLRVAYHGPFRENLESAFWGFGVSYHNLIRQVRVFKTEHLKCWSFDASPQSEWLITAHLERAFWALECHISAWLGRWLLEFWCLCPVRVAYQAHLGESRSQILGFEPVISPVSLIRQMQVFKNAPLEYCSFDAFLMPLPSQSGLSRLI